MKRRSPISQLFVITLACLGLSGCYNLRPSNGGGEATFAPPRRLNPADVAVPAGYKIELVASGFTFPTGVAFDEAGNPYVVESGYSYGEVWAAPRLLRVNPDGSKSELVRGGRNGPWTGVAYQDGNFYIAEGGELEGGRILRVTGDGNIVTLVQGLPSKGDHHTNGPAIGADGKIYFGQGTATNAGVVGEDNARFGWLKRYPAFHDTPCKDITLRGENYESGDVTGKRAGVITGAFSPFGTATTPGQVVRGALPCNGDIMRIDPDGSHLELVAWGFRNPFGLAFAPDGQLYLTENAYDDRGSRPVWGSGDMLWRVTPGAWYGWPDYSGSQSINSPAFKPPGKQVPKLLLANDPGIPPRPVAILGVHSSSNGLDFSRSASFGHVGEAFIAEFGDQSPETGKSLYPVGFRVVRVDVGNGTIEDFVTNKGNENGPASKLGTAGLERPLAVRFTPAGDALYVVDFGVMLMGAKGPMPLQNTGALWKITRHGGGR
jgi:glucose/arabinose dehydrogenase